MKIPVLHVKDGEHHFSGPFGELQPSGQDGAAALPVTVLVNRSGAMLECRVHLQGRVAAVCDKCLRDFLQPVEESFRLLLQVGEDRLHSAEEDVVTIAAETVEYDLHGRIEEQLLLSRPIKVLCRNNCRGLCADCGNDLNELAEGENCSCSEVQIDPRWEKLKELLK